MKNTPHTPSAGNRNADVFKVIGDWKIQAKTLKEKFPQLTDEDLKLEQDKDEVMLGRIETRLNKKRDEVINIIRKGQPAMGKP